MTNRQRVNVIMHYKSCDRMPAVAFGYWEETLIKWANQGHITREEAEGYRDNNEYDQSIMKKLGFDFNWACGFPANAFLDPPFPEEVLSEEKDGSRVLRNGEGLIIRVKPGVVSIPGQIGTSLTDRKAWETLYKPRLTFSPGRVNADAVKSALAAEDTRDLPLHMTLGSLYGNIRNMLGVEELSYLAVDDEELYVEIIDTMGKLSYDLTAYTLTTGIRFDFAHFWEDICFNGGPLVRPSVFSELVGPWYQKITGLLKENGVDIVSVDCDGKIDELLPIWLENGVNTMFPIEVGTWRASFDVWRGRYGRALRGVGGMDKRVFAMDYKAVDREIERLKPIVELGGYIPCPDHRIAPDAIFENVQYYCDRFRAAFG